MTCPPVVVPLQIRNVGHLRAEVTPDAEVPVMVLDIDETEADKILATLAAMAEADDSRAAGESDRQEGSAECLTSQH